MIRDLDDVWPSWRRRAEACKRDARKTDEELAAEVSELVGHQVIRSTVNHWFRGRRTPDLDEFMALCTALGADPGEILFNVRVSHYAISKSPEAAQALLKSADTPAYLKAQAQRIRAFKAKRRKTRLIR